MCTSFQRYETNFWTCLGFRGRSLLLIPLYIFNSRWLGARYYLRCPKVAFRFRRAS